MNAMELPIKVFDLDEEVTVTPMTWFWFGDFSAVYITDSNDRGLWLDYDCGWQVDVKEGDICDAEVIKGGGVDMEEWKASADERLADYGLRLGDLEKEYGDRHFPVSL